mgnify:CR=1 FL=1
MGAPAVLLKTTEDSCPANEGGKQNVSEMSVLTDSFLSGAELISTTLV